MGVPLMSASEWDVIVVTFTMVLSAFHSVGLCTESIPFPCHQWSIAQQLTHVTDWQHIAVLQEQEDNCSDAMFQTKPNSKPVTVIVETACSQNGTVSLDLLLLAAKERKINRFLLAVRWICFDELFDEILSLEKSNQGYFTFISEWIILADGRTELQLQNLSLPFYHVTMVTRNGKIYTLVRNGSTNILKQSEKSIHDSTAAKNIFPNRPYGFCGKHFTAATHLYPGFTEKVTDGGKAVYSGYIITIMDMLAKIHNFSYTLVEPVDGEWGALKNGLWTGLIGMVLRQEVDFVSAATTLTAEREDVVDFAYPYFTNYKVVIVKKTGLAAATWKVYTQPFSITLWAATIIGALLISAMFWIFSKTGIPDRWSENISDILFFTFGALLFQGCARQPMSGSLRILLGTWWLFCVILMQTYMGNLVASLASDREKLPFKTVEEMVEQEAIKYGVMAGEEFTAYLQNHADKAGYPFNKLRDKIEEFSRNDPSTKHTDYKFHFDKVLRGGYATFFDSQALANLLSNHNNLATFDAGVSAKHYSLVFANNSAYTDLFSNTIKRLRAYGFLKQWEKEYWPIKRKQKTIQGMRIAFSHVQSVCALAGVMVFTAFLILLYEVFAKEHNPACRKHIPMLYSLKRHSMIQ